MADVATSFGARTPITAYLSVPIQPFSDTMTSHELADILGESLPRLVQPCLEHAQSVLDRLVALDRADEDPYMPDARRPAEVYPLHRYNLFKALTKDEIAAVCMYAAIPEEGPGVHSLLNHALRHPLPHSRKPWYGYMHLLLRALCKLDAQPGLYFRGINRKLDSSDYMVSAVHRPPPV